jgi:hypothetical protein
MSAVEGESSIRTARRPMLVSLLVIILIGFGFEKLYRAIWYALQWKFVFSISQPLNWWYAFNSSLIMAFFSLLVGWWLFAGKRFARHAASIWMVAATILFWIEKGFLSMNTASRTGWAADVFLNLLVMIAIYLVLNSKQARMFFSKETQDD